MWITIVWPSGRERKKWMGSLRELDRIIDVHRAWGMTVDLESTPSGMVQMRLRAPGGEATA